ncbi:MAG: hypothetical protein FWF80_08120 [Defluviitaleaceae bacterium]|nr:hypothetical protein [Defluviitaleaceae bacterium]
MLQKINDKEIMTMQELIMKYPEHFIMAEITETVDSQVNDRGYVMYIADSMKELYDVPNEEEQGRRCFRMTGHNAEKPFSLGLMVYE